MIDGFERRIDYLRVSVTDRCNLRCVYCMPESGIPQIPHSSILRIEEIEKLVTLIDSAIGLRKIRITGGEPLVRRGITSLVQSVSAIAETVLTTNGVLLSQYAADLRAAGLSRVNISLDTLKDSVMKQITRRDVTLKIIEDAINAAKANALDPIKINCVVLDGVNTDELSDMVKWSENMGAVIRFIEHMPMTGSVGGFVSKKQILEELATYFGSVKQYSVEGTSEMYETASGHRFGIIAPVAGGMCSTCNRLRLTAEGELLPCLAGGRALQLGAMLRADTADDVMISEILKLVKEKPKFGACGGVSMWRIGG